MESSRGQITAVSSNHVIIIVITVVAILGSLKCEVMSGFSSRGIYLKERWRPRSDLWSQREWPNVIETWLHLCISLARCIPINIVCALCWQLDASRDQKYKHRKLFRGDRTWDGTVQFPQTVVSEGEAPLQEGGAESDKGSQEQATGSRREILKFLFCWIVTNWYKWAWTEPGSGPWLKYHSSQIFQNWKLWRTKTLLAWEMTNQ